MASNLCGDVQSEEGNNANASSLDGNAIHGCFFVLLLVVCARRNATWEIPAIALHGFAAGLAMTYPWIANRIIIHDTFSFFCSITSDGSLVLTKVLLYSTSEAMTTVAS